MYWLRMMISILLFLFSEPNAAASRWAFKAFAHEKAQMDLSDLNPGREFLLLVNTDCLASRGVGKGGGNLALPGIEVKHKNSGSLEVAAWSAKIVAPVSVADFKETLASDPCIVGASQDAIVRTATPSHDPMVNLQVALAVIRQDRGEDFFMHPLWGINKTTIAAVVDTGIQLDHPDLKSQIWRGPSGESGFDFANDDVDPSDDNGHGTHVSGILGAERDNNEGIRGVIGKSIKLMALKSQDSQGSGSLADMVNAIKWAADHGAEVINLSLAGNEKSTAVKDAIEYALAKNVVLVSAAGNEGSEITATNFITPAGHSPEYGGLIGVGSTDALTFLRSTFSNFGAAFIGMTAPGAVSGSEGILSTWIGSSYKTMIGTSQATPQVAGAAALAIGFLKSNGVPYTAAQIERALELSAKENAVVAQQFTNGRRVEIGNLGALLFNSTYIDSTGGFDGN